jgi:fumarate hydratase class I
MSDFAYNEMFPLSEVEKPFRRLTGDYVATAKFEGRKVLKVADAALEFLAAEAFRDVSHLLRPQHLEKLSVIFDDPEASDNDRYVAWELLKNANISAGMVLPMCQDTGTAIIMAKKGQQVWTEGHDEAALSKGIHHTYDESNLRFSQIAPLDMFSEINTGNNLPAQIDIYATVGNEYNFLFMAKGGGSANKTFLFQETKALLNPETLLKFIDDKIRGLGTAACPPYHLAVVIGGTSAELNLKTVKLASAHYLDGLPTKGSKHGRAFRDLEHEQQIHEITHKTGIGAQFGGKYFCHDVRVIRLPRHSASCPVGIGVSCSADRHVLGKITEEGVFLEQLETNPARFLPEVDESALVSGVVKINLDQSMHDIRKVLSQHPIKTRLSLTGPLVVARDVAHTKLRERVDAGGELPDYFHNHIIYYAGPAKTPEGYESGSFGPTTAGRMDPYVSLFQSLGGSMVMLAKGNRSEIVKESCKKYGGFYLGSVGGSAARLAQDCIRKVEVLEFPELGMEAIWKIEVENFPAFIIIDDKGNDFFADIISPVHNNS